MAQSRIRLLAAAAFAVMRERSTDADRATLLAAMASVRDESDVTASAALAAGEENGILIERAPGRFAFAHLTIQEYLAARHIRTRDPLVLQLENGVDDLWWRDVTLFWAADGSPDDVVEACLRSGSVAALSLAAECMENNNCASSILRTRLAMLLQSAYDGTADRHHRLLVAGVESARALQHPVFLDAGSWICPEPIPQRLYCLFEHDVPGAKIGDGTRPPSKPDMPAIGSWGSDVQSFVSWINALADQNEEPPHRLPTRAELDELATRTDPATEAARALTSVWIQGRWADDPVLWSSPHSESPHRVRGAEMVSALRTDLSDQHVTATLIARLLPARAGLLRRTVLEAQARASKVADVLARRLKRIANHHRRTAEDLENNDEWARGGFDDPAMPLTRPLSRDEEIRRARRLQKKYERAYRRAVDAAFDTKGATLRWRNGQAHGHGTDFECKEELEAGTRASQDKCWKLQLRPLYFLCPRSLDTALLNCGAVRHPARQ